MVSVMTSPIVFADTSSTELTSQKQVFKKAEFFLFLANSVELDNKLTTPIDIADLEDLEKEELVNDTKTELSAEERP